MPGNFILYKFASHCDNDVIYNLYIYNTYIVFEYEDNNFFTYHGPYTIDIIHGFWENMSSQNKNLIFNLVFTAGTILNDTIYIKKK